MRRSALLLYLAMTAGAVVLFLLVRAHGEALTAPEAAAPAGPAAAPKGDALLRVLVALGWRTSAPLLQLLTPRPDGPQRPDEAPDDSLEVCDEAAGR
jgi:hypothetical protein